MSNEPTVRHIVAVVRLKSPQGCTAAYVARITGASLQAVRKALDLQVQADVLSTEEQFDGEKYLDCLYRVRETK